MEFDGLSNRVIGCAIEVHRYFGLRLLESAYEQCLAHERSRAGIELLVNFNVTRLKNGHQAFCSLIPSCSSCPSWCDDGPSLQSGSSGRGNNSGEIG